MPPHDMISRPADDDPDRERAIGCLLALSSLPDMGPARLRAITSDCNPTEAWSRVASGGLDDCGVPVSLIRQWQRDALSVSPDDMAATHRSAGVHVTAAGWSGWPARLDRDPEPPAMLVSRGRAGVLDQPTVAVVGTRRCTRYGRDIAFELGCILGAAGVSVVSGLALGIDAAAHAGALESGGRPIGVVASGLDCIYPRQNTALWERVATEGLLLSEHPLGVRGRRWMFPARNRIIAGLADVVVVVESGRSGGSMYTVDAAMERDRPVVAVPGPMRSEASAGTNRLIADGAHPLCSPTEVLELLGHTSRPPTAAPRPPLAEPTPGRRGHILAALGWQPATVDELAERTGIDATAVATDLQLLVAARTVVQRGAWFERTVTRAVTRGG